MREVTILNYPGSKRKLLQYIHCELDKYIKKDDVILDIFSGAGCISYSYKKQNIVIANDIEKYASIIASALLGPGLKINEVCCKVWERFYDDLLPECRIFVDMEDKFIREENINGLIELYDKFLTIWNSDIYRSLNRKGYNLFQKYYSTNYFGIKQSIQIDAMKKAIDFYQDDNIKNILYASLFFAMKECVFSKDGHMAQPLDMRTNERKLLHKRQRDIFYYLDVKLKEFASDEFIKQNYKKNDVYNLDLEDVLNVNEIAEKVDVIYADPPYTDMQYSRYYHLLNTVVEYNYPKPTIVNGGYTKGLYLENRIQSKLSKKSTGAKMLEKLIRFAREYNKTLAISFAYPQNVQKQKTSRYIIDIKDLIALCKGIYGEQSVHLSNIEYKHSNNRNSYSKNVIEYLIICEKTC